MEPDDCIITVIIVKRRDETGLCVSNMLASEDKYFEKAFRQCWECQVNHSYSAEQNIGLQNTGNKRFMNECRREHGCNPGFILVHTETQNRRSTE